MRNTGLVVWVLAVIIVICFALGFALQGNGAGSGDTGGPPGTGAGGCCYQGGTTINRGGSSGGVNGGSTGGGEEGGDEGGTGGGTGGGAGGGAGGEGGE